VPPPSEGRFLATAAQQTHARPQVSHSTGSYSSLYASSHNTGYTRASAYSNAQSRAASPFDHFAHDAEAYASGAASRAAWQPPRSRSPTPAPDAPAVDEDEYLITSSGAVMNPANLSVDDGMPGSFSPRKSPARKDAAAQQKSKPKWIPTILPPGLPLHGRSQVPGSIRSGHSGDAPSFDARSIPASPLPTRHFGPAPSGRAQRRNKGVTKRVQLTNGNLILELAVPPKMVLPFKREPEMATTRYTAVHGDPNHFERNGFSLRQNLFNRTTELLIVLTMFNEDEVLFCRTLHG
jgi:chitin synthase